ncbi:MAG: hypothetical protein ACJ72Y_02020 [Actinomycetes bacterium]
MTLTVPEVMGAGPPPRNDTTAKWRRRAFQGVIAVVVLVTLVWAAFDLGAWRTHPPVTGIRLLTTGPDGLAWVDVDTGTRTSVDAAPDANWSNAVVVGDSVVVRYPSSDSDFAAQVVAYRDGEEPHDVGEADKVIPQSGQALWLVVDGDAGVSGGAALTTSFGEWRSRVFSIPPRLDVVGAVNDTLVVARGETRYRRLLMWDVQGGDVVRRYGLVVGVRQVAHGRALVTTGCLISGCTSALVNLRTGRSSDVKIPVGYFESAAPVVTPDGVALVVADDRGRAHLAAGSPQHLEIVDTPGVDLTRGVQPLSTSGGWLILAGAGGVVSAWREGLDPQLIPSVHLTSDERVIGVSG